MHRSSDYRLIDKWLKGVSASYFGYDHDKAIVKDVNWEEEKGWLSRSQEQRTLAQRSALMQQAWKATKATWGPEEIELEVSYPWLIPGVHHTGLLTKFTVLLLNWPILLPYETVLSAWQEATRDPKFHPAFLGQYLVRSVCRQFPEFNRSTAWAELSQLVEYAESSHFTPFELWRRLSEEWKSGKLEFNSRIETALRAKEKQLRRLERDGLKLWSERPFVDAAQATTIDWMEASGYSNRYAMIHPPTILTNFDNEQDVSLSPSRSSTGSTNSSARSVFIPLKRRMRRFSRPAIFRSPTLLHTPRESPASSTADSPITSYQGTWGKATRDHRERS